jgi:hypothetical protein
VHAFHADELVMSVKHTIAWRLSMGLGNRVRGGPATRRGSKTSLRPTAACPTWLLAAMRCASGPTRNPVRSTVNHR